MKVTTMNKNAINPVKAQRLKLGMNQSEFWIPIGVTQTSGSRYECGRNIPRPLSIVLSMRYGKNPVTQLARLRGVTVDELKAGK